MGQDTGLGGTMTASGPSGTLRAAVGGAASAEDPIQALMPPPSPVARSGSPVQQSFSKSRPPRGMNAQALILPPPSPVAQRKENVSVTAAAGGISGDAGPGAEQGGG